VVASIVFTDDIDPVFEGSETWEEFFVAVGFIEAFNV